MFRFSNFQNPYDKLDGHLRVRLEGFGIFLFALAFVLASLFSRCPSLLGINRSYLNAYFSLQAIVSLTLLLFVWPRAALLITGLFTLILTHAFANLYWPSLRWDTPFQDFMYFDGVSSNYSFDMAKLYLKNIGWFLPGALLVGATWSRVKNYTKVISCSLIGFGVFCNVVVAGIQGSMTLDFLAAGSGTAVAAKRAAAMLEDSGASTVYMSAVVVMSYAAFLFLRRSQLKFLCGFLFLLSLVLGRYTGGRTFFAASLVSVFFISAIYAYALLKSGSRKAPWILSIALLPTLVILSFGFYYFSPPKFQRIFKVISISNFSGDLSIIPRRIDPGRWKHYQILTADIRDHFYFGSGLGSFHGNNLYYSKHLSLGAVLLDNPSNLYLTIIAALGLAGLLLLFGILILIWKCASWLVSINNIRFPFNSWDVLLVSSGFAVIVALFVSFFFGVHLIFVSTGAMIGLGAASIAFVVRTKPGLASINCVQILTLAALLLLSLRIGYLTVTAPHSPEFRWRERGQSQIANSVNVPISSQNYPGGWLVSGAEVFFDGKDKIFFVELPPQNYPLTVQFRLFGKRNEPLKAQDVAIESQGNPPWRLLTFSASDHQDCADTPGPEAYCYLRVETKPTWIWDSYRIGVFLVSGDPTAVK